LISLKESIILIVMGLDGTVMSVCRTTVFGFVRKLKGLKRELKPLKRSVMVVAKYKCPYCGKEFDHLLVYAIHVVEKHKEKEEVKNGVEGEKG